RLIRLTTCRSKTQNAAQGSIPDGKRIIAKTLPHYGRVFAIILLFILYVCFILLNLHKSTSFVGSTQTSKWSQAQIYQQVRRKPIGRLFKARILPFFSTKANERSKWT
ncbi:MAG: hypothetical protein SPH01_01810, partial [Prevotella sp.]|nr:hypothetical protein [Prevotella sp.]